MTKESIARHRGALLGRSENHLDLLPHPLLRPYISNYTVSFPSPVVMPDAYAIMPSASATLVMAAGPCGVEMGLRGVNTRMVAVGAYANQFPLLFLIEFHAGGLFPFLGVDQTEMQDASFAMQDVAPGFRAPLADALLAATEIQSLVDSMDALLLGWLGDGQGSEVVAALKHSIIRARGDISLRQLSGTLHYSEKHLRRVFSRQMGVTPKQFARIARVNYAIRLMQQQPGCLADVAAEAGYFDQPHLIHDFTALCGVTPQVYLRDMAVFYNETFKL